MALSPEEIRSQSFPSSRRGYDTDAVDGHLATLAEQMAAHHDEIRLLEERLADALVTEERMSETVASFAATRQGLLRAAEEEAAQIRKRAARDADRVRRIAEDDARAEAMRSRSESLEAMARARAETEQVMAIGRRHEAELRERIEQLRGVVRRTENLLKGMASGALGELAQAHLMLDEAPDVVALRTIEVVVSDEGEAAPPACDEGAHDEAGACEQSNPLPAAVNRLLSQLRDIG